MNEKLKKLRKQLTELIRQGVERGKAYKDAGYHSKTHKVSQQRACKLLTDNEKVMAYLDALRANDSRTTSITRTMQLNRLNTLYNLAIKQKNVSAGASVIREQNEMLGFHREHAPNLEKEQQLKDIVDRELKELERLSKKRTEELSNTNTRQSGQVIKKIG